MLKILLFILLITIICANYENVEEEKLYENQLTDK